MRKKILAAKKKVEQEIADNSKKGRFAAGLASEGYAGGYGDALDDVMLLMSKVTPRRRNYWLEDGK